MVVCQNAILRAYEEAVRERLKDVVPDCIVEIYQRFEYPESIQRRVEQGGRFVQFLFVENPDGFTVCRPGYEEDEFGTGFTVSLVQEYASKLYVHDDPDSIERILGVLIDYIQKEVDDKVKNEEWRMTMTEMYPTQVQEFGFEESLFFFWKQRAQRFGSTSFVFGRSRSCSKGPELDR